MLRVCPSDLKALIFVNTTPFPMTHRSGLYHYSWASVHKCCYCVNTSGDTSPSYGSSPLADKKCYALCNKEKGRIILSRCRSVGDE
jgi:hypothetical protein